MSAPHWFHSLIHEIGRRLHRWWESDATHHVNEIDAILLEDRVLYSATPFPLDELQGDGNANGSAVDPSVQDLLDKIDTLFEEAAFQVPIESPTALSIEAATIESESNQIQETEGSIVNQVDTSSTSVDLVLIDSRLDDFQALLDSIDDSARILIFDSLNDSTSQVLDRAIDWADSSNTTIDTLSILSHGAAGGFELGNSWVTLDSIGTYAVQWLQLAGYFEDDADILIFGCNVVQDGSDGQSLIDELAALTNTEVFASSNLTGQGGDWILEASSYGAVEEQLLAFDAPLDLDSLEASDATLAWYSTSWGYRKQLTIDMHKVSGGSDLTDFAVLVDLSSDADLAARALASGNDILFTSADGTTKLAHEIEVFTSASGKLVAWVKVPNVSASENTVLYMYYGNSSATNQQNETGVWTNSYSAVYHLSDSGTTVNDSTSNGLDGTEVNSPTATTGEIGNALSFDGFNDYVNLGANRNFASGASAATFSMWINPNSAFSTDSIWEISTNNSGFSTINSRLSIVKNFDEIHLIVRSNDSTVNTFTTNTSPISSNSWHYITAVVDVANDLVQVYVDGVLELSSAVGFTATAFPSTTSAVTALGAQDDGSSQHFWGEIDEARLSTTSRTAGWIATEYNSQSSPSTFYTLSSQMSAPVGTVPGTQSTNEDTTRVFSSANGNQISIAELDAGSSSNEVTVSVTNGTLTLAGITGLTFSSGDGTSDATMTFRGTVANINTALNGLSYIPTPNYNGSSTLTISSRDSSLVSLDFNANASARYTFDGNANDVAPGTAQNGTLNGNATYINDATRGEVLSLDGVGDFVQVSGVYSNPTNLTVGGWVNLSTAVGRAEFISLSDRVHIALDQGSGVGVKGSIQTGASTWVDLASGMFIAGKGWHHVMYVFDDTNNINTLYIDGAAVASASIASSIYYTGATNTFIGSHPSGVNYLNGMVDDVRIFNRALSSAEVLALANDLDLTDSDNVNITVNPVNDAPTVTSGSFSLASIDENTISTTYTVASLLTSSGYADVDASASSGIAITTKAGNGTWQYSTNGTTWTAFGGVTTTNSLLLSSTAQIRYSPDLQNGETASFAFRAWDQTTGTASASGSPVYTDTSTTGGTTSFSTNKSTASITVTSLNDAPTITNAASVTLSGTDENTTSPGTLASTILTSSSWGDVDTGPSSGLAITATTGNGTWQYSTDGTTWQNFGAVSSTNALLITSTTQVRYIPDNNNGETATFAYRAWDQTTGTPSTNSTAAYATTASNGGATAFSTSIATASLTVTAVNDAPTITNAASVTLSGTDENTTSSGTLASTILSSSSWGDVDSSPLSGLAITATTGNGTWQYSTNGTTWQAFGSVSSTNALLITSTTQVRYIPDNNNGETATFSYRAWDQTSGTASTNITAAYATTASNGTTTAFSTSIATASITVTSVNDAPTITNAASVTLTGTDEDTTSSGTLASTILASSSWADVDPSPSSGLAITATTGNGTWQYSTDGTTWQNFGAVSSTNTLLITSTTQVRYIPDNNNGETATFAYRAWDQTTGTPSTNSTAAYATTASNGGSTPFSTSIATALITVTSVNDAPTITNAASVTLSGTDENTTSSGTLASTILSSSSWADVDSSTLSGLAITATTGNGTWQYSTNGTTWQAFGSVSSTNALLITSTTQVRYIPDNNNGETATFSYRAWDQTSGTASTNTTAAYATTASNGGTTAFSTSSATASITVTSVNDAPTITNAASVTLTGTDEDTTSSGTLASTILSSSSWADVDPSPSSGLAITATTGNGTWQYSTDGTTWQAFGAVSSTNALLITSTTQVRYIPDNNNGETATFAYRAWDQTTGTPSTNSTAAYATTASNGGSTPFSTSIATASMTVTAVNDAPTITNAASVTLSGTDENTTSSGTLASTILASSSWADVDSSPLSGLAITATTGNGTWQYSTNGTTWQAFGSVSSTNALLITSTTQVRYIPDNNNGETATFYYRAWDQTSGTASTNTTAAYATTASNGGTTAFSTSSAIASITVTSVNDAPTITNAASVTLTGTDEDTTSSGTLASTILTSSSWADVDPSPSSGLAITATTGNGTWQYSTNGTTWQNFGGVSSTNALLLTSTTQVRYIPDNNNGETATFAYRAWDQTSGTASTNSTAAYATTASNGGSTPFSTSIATASMTVTSVNDAPTITNASSVTLSGTDENTTSSGTLASTILSSSSWAEVDSSPLSGLAITATTGNGTWQYSTNGTTWQNFGAVSSTNALLITSTTQVRYIPDNNNGETATFSYRAWDQTSGTASTNTTAAYATTASNGGTTAFSTSLATSSITVTSVNDAPTITNAASVTLTGTDEDTTSSGTLASTILASSSWADVDPIPSSGLAITATTGNGTWQYSTDGTTWQSFGAVSSTNALLITSTTQVRYIPDNNNGETATFAYRAWDQTTGTASTNATAAYATTASNGGSTAFSTSIATASMTVTAVNDAPTMQNGGVIALPNTNEDAASAAASISSILLSSSQSDVDTGALGGMAVTGFTGNGTWQFSNNGTTWTSFGSVSATNSLLLSSSASIRYMPDGLNGETAEITYRAWDRTSGSVSSDGSPVYEDSSIHGGTYAYSSEVMTGRVVVSNVNDSATAMNDGGAASEAGGYNNASAGSNPTGNVLSNDTDVDLGDTMTISGVASGIVSSASGNVNIAVNGTYGSLTIDSTGNYVYTVDNNNSIVQALRTSGQTLTDTFTYTLQDSAGAPASAQLVITISGANDAPIATDDNSIAIEAGGVSNGTAGNNPTGNVLTNDTDVDGGDSKSVTGVVVGSQSSASGNVGSAIVGTYGSITINSAGAFTYIVDNSNSVIQALRNSSHTVQDVFTYTMVDAAGLASTSHVTLTIQGANDAPIASNDQTIAVEAGGTSNGTAGVNPSGNVLSNDTDIDTGDTKTVVGVIAGTSPSATGSVAVNVAGSYGTVTIQGDGSYSYSVDNSNAIVQALRNSSQTLTDYFTYTMEDTAGLKSTATLSITIQGANDAPIAVMNTVVALEAGGISNNISGTDPTGNVLTNDTDVDSGDSKTVTGVAAGTQVSASGSVGNSVVGSFGTLVVNSNGTYSYTVNNSNATIEALNHGQSVTDTFTYTMTDAIGLASTSTLVVTIEGADDLPFAVVDFDTSVEAGGISNGVAGTSPTGNVFTNDVTPNGNTLTGVAAGVQASASGNVNSSVVGNYGSIVINSSGNYTYSLNNSLTIVEALRVSGDHLTDIFTYTFQDSLGYFASTQITITIDGTNDNPIAMNDVAIAVEAGGQSNGSPGSAATGTVFANDTDVDTGDAKAVIGAIAGAASSASGHVGAALLGSYGSIVINADGTFNYSVDNTLPSVQALRTNLQTLTDIFTYTIEDLSGATATATLTITIQGQNDTPVAVVDTITAVEAGGVADGTAGTNPSGNVLTNDVDVDNSDSKTVLGVLAGNSGSPTSNAGTGVAGSYGSVQINSDGTFTYTVDNSNTTVRALRNSGQTLQDVFTYTVSDTAGAISSSQLTVTIQGANDNPVAFNDTAIAVEAGGTANGTAGTNPTGNVLNNDIDQDSGDSKVVSGVEAGVQSSAVGGVGTSIAGAYGSIQIANDGSYIYVVDNANLNVQALRTSSDHLTDIFTYSIQDSLSAAATAYITITIQGQNDAPVGISDNGVAVESGGLDNATLGSNATGNVLTNDIEFDSGDSNTVLGLAAGVTTSTLNTNLAIPAIGNFGSLSISSNGAYTYVVDESNTTVQALRLNSETVQDVFSYTVTDLAGLVSTTQITITITGANDAPIAVTDQVTAVEAYGYANATTGTNPSGNVLVNDIDVDSGDTKTVIGVAVGTVTSAGSQVGSLLTGTYGQFTLSANGSYTYVVDNSNAAIEALRNSSETLQDIFTYSMQDAAGVVSTTQVTVTIQGRNDAPTDLTTGPLSIAENASNGSSLGFASSTDIDATDTFTYSLTIDASGRFAINASTGEITVANGTLLDRENAANHSITIRSSDAAGLFYEETFSIALIDVDEFDVGSITDTNGTTNSILENASIGTAVGVTAFATDSDATNNTITYSLFDNDGGRFAIHSTTGVISNAVLLDRENDGATRTVTVRATSTDGSISDQQFTINIVDVNEYATSSVVDTDSTSNAVDENAAIGTVVGITGYAYDSDATTNGITYSLFSDDGGRFAIDSSTGIVTTAMALDRETDGATRSITVRATSADGSFSDQTFSININDLDEFDVGSITDTNGSTNSILENASIGTAVGVTSFATDSDATNNTITYSLFDNDGGRFAIHSTTGVISNAVLLDRENDGATRTVTVRATSTDGSISDQLFTINIVDVNEFATSSVVDTDSTSNAVDENAAIGTVVGITGYAYDSDATTNGITYSLFSDDGGRFAIDSSTGIVTTAMALDRETDGATRSITVRATSADGSFSNQTFSININDLDEFDVGSITDTNGTTNSILENASIGTSVGVTAFATDSDATNNTITYSLFDNDGGRFAIHSTTGVISNAVLLDRETDGATRTVTVRATSTDGSISDQLFTINIVDVNEYATSSVVDTDSTSNAVDENAAIGTVVGITGYAYDSDATTNGINYSLFSNDGGRFAIDSSTGIVTTAMALDRETDGATRSITVRATSADGSFSDQTFSININDLDEFNVGSITDTNGTTNSILENASIGTAVGVTALATDSDATNNSITYSLFDNDGGRFAIHSTTGVISNAVLLDRETDGATRTVTVRATSTDGSINDQLFTINIVDINEFATSSVVDTDSTSNAVDENASIGTVVGITGYAYDSDATTNGITYSLFSNDGGRFAIDSSTGIVTTAMALDRETDGATRSITVRATSADGSFSDQTFSININDLDDFDIGPVSDINAANNIIVENSAIGTTVGVMAFAADPDATNNVVTYTLFDDDGGRFEIDAATGVISNAMILNREIDGANRSVTVRATSVDGSFSDQSFSIAIADQDEFDTSALSDSNNAVNEILENASNGSIVGITGLATDADATNNNITYSLDDDAGGRFAIDNASGIVSVANGSMLDFESSFSHQIIIRATSSDSSFSVQQFTIQVRDGNEGGVSSISDSNGTIDAVLENSAIGTGVGIDVAATDPDGTDSVTFSLDDNAGNRFAIDSITGEVSVAGSIDREVSDSYSIIVRATSTDGSFSTQSFSVSIGDVDEFDTSAIGDLDALANSVDENASTGAIVGIIATAFDADSTNNTIQYSLTDDANGRFAIHATTGTVTVLDGTLLDYETTTSHQIQVRATSLDGSFSLQTFTIQLIDVNEAGVGSISDLDSASNFLLENSTIGTHVGIAASANDPDGTATITYSLADDAGGIFTIDSQSGLVSLSGSVDRESASSYDIVVQATSSDMSSSTQSFTIFIGDLDEFDVGSISDTNAGLNQVSENSAIGTFVGITAHATDFDATNNSVTYSLTNDDGGRFSIDAVTGVVRVAGSLDRENDGASRSITIRATSSDGSISTQSFSIGILDVNDIAIGAISDVDPTFEAIDENSSIGSFVGITAFASDNDATNNSVSYSLLNDDQGRFTIDGSTGVISLASTIDRETDGPQRSVTVRALSIDGSHSDRIYTIAINDVNEFNISPFVDSDAGANFVIENSSIGTFVGIAAFASDNDATTNHISYSLDDSAGGRFAIDALTGIVSVANSSFIDYEASLVHNITVRGTSADGSTTTQNWTISIGDANEFAVIAPIDIDPTTNSVFENSANGTTVGITSFATDADGTNHVVSYSLFDTGGGRFSIDSSSGVVSVANGLAVDRETATQYSITVRAFSQDGSFADSIFAISVLDVDEFDVGTITDSNAFSNIVAENSTTGTLVGVTATAFDIDPTFSTISYSLDDDANGTYSIDTTTGVVSIADGSLLDFEGSSTSSFVVRATSQDGSFSTQTFTIQVSDVNEFGVSGLADIDLSTNRVLEGASLGTSVGIEVSAVDLDGSNNQISYSLQDSSAGRFQIDSVSGVVSVANGATIDFESTPNLTIVVRAASSDGSFAIANVVIQIDDVIEAPTANDDFYSTTFVDTIHQPANSLLANDFSPGNLRLQAVLVFAPSSGILVLNDDGSFDYIPEPGFTGQLTFGYQATDGTNLSNIALAVIEVSLPLNLNGSGISTDSGGTTSSGYDSMSHSTVTANGQDITTLSSSYSADVFNSNSDSTDRSNRDLKPQSPETQIAANSSAGPFNLQLDSEESESRLAVDSELGISGLLRNSNYVVISHLDSEPESHESGSLSTHFNRRLGSNSERQFSPFTLDRRQNDAQNEQFHFEIQEEIVQTVISTGIVIWVIQGAQLLATFLSVAPAYLQLDPLHVLSKSNEDDLLDESEDAFMLFDKNSK